MPQVIETKNKIKITKTNEEIYKEINNKDKTSFQKEWDEAIPADKAFDELLTHVRSLWKK